MPFADLTSDARLGRIINGSAPPPPEQQWRDPRTLAAEQSDTQQQWDRAVPAWAQALNMLMSVLPATTAAGGSNFTTAAGVRRSAMRPTGSQPPQAGESSGRGFQALSDAATRMAIQQVQSGQTPIAEVRPQLMERYAPVFYGQSSRYVPSNPTPDKYKTPERQGASMNPEVGGGSGVPVPKVASEDVAHQVMADRLDSAIKTYDTSAATPFGGYLKKPASEAAREVRQQSSAIPQPEYNPLSRQIAALDREWGASTKPGGGGGEGQRAPDAVVGRKLGMSPDAVRTARAQMEREQTRSAVSFDTLDRMADPNASPLARVEDAQDKGGQIDTIRNALAGMNERDRRVFLAYRDPDNPRTAADIAASEGVSRQMIDKIIKRSNKFIQDMSSGSGFAGKQPGKPIGGSSDVEGPWGSKPTRTRPLTPRELGTNPRASEQDPRQPLSSASDRFQGNNPRAKDDLLAQRDDWFKQKLEENGLRYHSSTDLPGTGRVHWYTDPQTGSTGIVRNPEDVGKLPQHIIEQRAKFKNNPPRSLGSAANDYQTPMSPEGHAQLKALGMSQSKLGGMMPPGGLKDKQPYTHVIDAYDKDRIPLNEDLKNYPLSPEWRVDFSGHRPPAVTPPSRNAEPGDMRPGDTFAVTPRGFQYIDPEAGRRGAILDAVKQHERAAAQGKQDQGTEDRLLELFFHALRPPYSRGTN